MERLFSSPLNSRDAPRRKNGAAKIRSVTLQEQQGENEHAFSHGHYWKSWGATARHLLKQGKQARALVRNREKAAKWADKGVEGNSATRSLFPETDLDRARPALRLKLQASKRALWVGGGRHPFVAWESLVWSSAAHTGSG
jgi:hypothetical protein